MEKRWAVWTVGTIALTVVFLWLFPMHPAGPPPFLGTWTEEAGESGNSIRFELVPAALPKHWSGIEALEGKASFRGYFGPGEQAANWTFAGHRPIQLNISFPQKTTFAALEMIGADRLRIRFDDDPVPLMRSDALRGPNVRVLRRVDASAK